jgi:hypothetical protein
MCVRAVAAPSMLARMLRSDATIAAALAVAVTLWAHWLQPPLTLQHGAAWDGGHYLYTATQVAEGLVRNWTAEPYGHRVGVPLLVGELCRLTGVEPLRLFHAVNNVAGVLAAVALYAWLGSFVASSTLRVVGLLLFLFQWCGPVRYNAWYPTLVDPCWWAAWCFGLLGLEYIRQGRRGAALLFSTALAGAILCRETGVWLWFGTLALLRTRRGVTVCVVSGGVAAVTLFLAYALTHTSVDALLQGTLAHAALRTSTRSWPLLALAAAVAFGPILTLLAGDLRGVARELSEHAYQVPIIAAMGIGINSEVRVMYWAAPFVYAALVTVLRRLQLVRSGAWELIASLVVLQAIAARVFWPIPDVPVIGATPSLVWLTPWGSTGPFGELDVWWASENVRTTVAQQYTVSCAALLFLLACHRLRAYGGGRAA